MKKLMFVPFLFVCLAASAQTPAPAAGAGQKPAPPAAPSAPASAATQVTFYGSPQGQISSGVVIPPNRAWVWTSGTTPSAADPNAKAGTRERFGDTRTQAASILRNIQQQLEKQGMSMRDVVYLRAYLVPDPTMNNQIDTAGWNAAYGEFFNTATNPTRPARSTVGVVALVNADWLIEVEAFAVVPQK
jgi:enamine deaminase RidA (YjgF/YER057c/UK114 family)